jgi:hypothetical protein
MLTVLEGMDFFHAKGRVNVRYRGAWIVTAYAGEHRQDELIDKGPDGPTSDAVTNMLTKVGLSELVTKVTVYIDEQARLMKHPVSD